jgi:hypothetical protein
LSGSTDLRSLFGQTVDICEIAIDGRVIESCFLRNSEFYVGFLQKARARLAIRPISKTVKPQRCVMRDRLNLTIKVGISVENNEVDGIGIGEVYSLEVQ